MSTRFCRAALMTAATLFLAACGNKETKVALEQATALENQKQYQGANNVLVQALQAREAKLRADNAALSSPLPVDEMNKKIQGDSEILKMERTQIPLYLHLERADLASAVYSDIAAGSPGDPVVTDALRDPDPTVRMNAAQTLALVGSAGSIPALTAATKDSEKDVRRAAVAALGAIKDPSAVPPLLDALKDSYWFVRSDAAGALGRQRDFRAIKPLLDEVPDSDPNVESSSENSLILLCSVANTPHQDFAARLNDPNPKIVLISAVCLALLKDPQATPVLLKLAGGDDLTTRLHAIKALGETGDASAVPLLRQAMKDPNPDVRGWSIISLGHLKDQGSVNDIRAVANDPNQSPTMHAAANAAIEAITGESATAAPPAPVHKP